MYLKRSDYYYDLPEELIAQHPIADRSGSRLLVVDGAEGSFADAAFRDIVDLIHPGDCLVLNDTKVIRARLLGIKKDSAIPVEFLLLERKETDVWEVICKPGRRLKKGAEAVFNPGRLEAEVLEVLENGNRLVRFSYEGIWEEILDETGLVPLPPYIHEQLEEPERYQTVYAKHQGSAAAPTAGLHFTPALLEQLAQKGVRLAYVTLHVGLGTFRPVKEQNITDHHMHSEAYFVSEEAASLINETKRAGGRIICTGTTSCRVVESASDDSGFIQAGNGKTEIFIYPGYQFKIIDALITNFHLPESTLIMLVSALGGYDTVLQAYRHAVNERYRFFSFGDAMFVTKTDMRSEK